MKRIPVPPSISVLIRTKNESKYLGKVLQRLQEQAYEGTVEILLVDSGSSDATVTIAERFGCRIFHLRPEEFSFGRSLNIGFENAHGDIVINLSGHSVPAATDYFQSMVQPFSDQNVAAAFGRDVPWPDACPSQARDILNHFPETGLDGNKFSNANAAVRKKVWEKIKFNETLPACEDFLWAQTVLKLGHHIVYVPEARVFHSHTPSLSYIYKRYLKERKAIKYLLNMPDMHLKDIVRNSYRQVKGDFRFMKNKHYNKKWYLHIPFYRLSQEAGLYMGSKTADRSRVRCIKTE